MNKKNIFLPFVLIFLLYQAINLNADDNTYINSSNITYNEEKNIVELAENSKINFKNTNILIDKGIIDYNKNEFEVFGNFYLYEELNILSGKNLKGNTSLDVFDAQEVDYIYNNDLKIDSKKIKRESNLLYFFDNFLTPCDLNGFFNCPTWSLRIDKTEYDIEKDKFTHFDTFLQIADYKLFYLPYFSHYGTKAPRQKGFLTPTIEFSLGGNQAISVPYYFPINDSTDMTIKTKLSFDENFEFYENYNLNTEINKKSSGGNTKLNITNIKTGNKSNINNELRFETKNVLSKNQIISAKGLFTNSISTSRSINEEPITFEDIYLRLENYDYFIRDDYLKTELSSVESFEPLNDSTIPIAPNINYVNQIYLSDRTLTTDLNFTILKRDDSTSIDPSESLRLSLNNELFESKNFSSFNIFNKLTFMNSFSDYHFNKNIDLNNRAIKSFSIISSDIYLNSLKNFTPRLKFILPIQLENTDKSVNEDSESITFSYQNQYSENRFFGNDLFDSTPRIVFGLENSFNLINQKIDFNFNQSYQFNSNNSYSEEINQNSNLSDYALEAKTNFKDISLKIDSRIDQNNFSKKEMNLLIDYENIFNFNLKYNETQSTAFKDLSSDTQAVKFGISKKLNKNITAEYSSNLDVKNGYDPFKSVLQISLHDECSQLDIKYSNTRYSDNYNTKPLETISLTFAMDYLGFFGYEQRTDLFFSDPGELNYGF